tara:strand:+ start:753 stop:911 length:159 start_codon:yes stop_codon:yes gene_type:complete
MKKYNKDSIIKIKKGGKDVYFIPKSLIIQLNPKYFSLTKQQIKKKPITVDFS